MADQATRLLRVWRGDKGGGGLADYTVPVHAGEVLVQRRDQRPAIPAVHDPAVHVDGLAPDEELVVPAPFEPVPLEGVLASRRFGCQATELSDGN